MKELLIPTAFLSGGFLQYKLYKNYLRKYPTNNVMMATTCILTALLFTIIIESNLDNTKTPFILLSIVILVSIARIDLEQQIIPDELNLGILGIGLIWLITNPNSENLVSAINGLIIGAGVILVLALISNGGFGGGDIKLIGTLGFLLGSSIIIKVILTALMFGALWGLLLVINNKRNLKKTIPFAPAILIATIYSMVIL